MSLEPFSGSGDGGNSKLEGAAPGKSGAEMFGR